MINFIIKNNIVKTMKKGNLLFIVIEVIGVIMLSLGFKTRGVISVVLGVTGLSIVVMTAWYFSERTSK